MKVKSILILLMLILSIGIVSADSLVVKKELIKSEYGDLGSLFNVGDRLYKITYSDSTFEYVLERASIFQSFFITSIPTTVSVPIGGYIDIPITITGISSVMDGQSSHTHVIRVYDSNDILVTNREYSVNSGKTFSATLQLGQISTSGVYNYVVKESIWLVMTLSTGEKLYTEARGDTAYVTVTVGNPQPTYTTPSPTQTTPTPTVTVNCVDGTTNLACSSQKPLYCYYGSLIDKSSQCGCPTGKTPSGDSCIVVSPTVTTPTPTQTTPGQTTQPPVNGDGDDNTAILVVVGIILMSGIVLVMGRKKR